MLIFKGNICLFLGSPFLLNVGGDPSGRIRETITKDMEQAEAITPNTFCQFLLKIPGKSMHSVKMLGFYLLANNVVKSYKLDPDKARTSGGSNYIPGLRKK